MLEVWRISLTLGAGVPVSAPPRCQIVSCSGERPWNQGPGSNAVSPCFRPSPHRQILSCDGQLQAGGAPASLSFAASDVGGPRHACRFPWPTSRHAGRPWNQRPGFNAVSPCFRPSSNSQIILYDGQPQAGGAPAFAPPPTIKSYRAMVILWGASLLSPRLDNKSYRVAGGVPGTMALDSIP